MKKALFFSLLFVSHFIFSQETWRPFDGIDNFNQPSESAVGNTCTAIGTDNAIYVLYATDAQFSTYFELTLKKFSNNKWETVGNPSIYTGLENEYYGYTSSAKFISLALNNENVPYVAYSEQSNISKKISVKKFNGVSWELVGSDGFSAGETSSNNILIDHNNVPYVVYNDKHNGGITVQKFNGVSWEVVGNPSFSDGSVDYTKLAFDNLNQPIVIYKDNDNGGKATVKRFNGLIWETIGTAGLSLATIKSPSIAVDTNNIIYISYLQDDLTLTHVVEVMKFVGNSWQSIDTSSTTPQYGYYFPSLYTIFIKIDNSNSPVLMLESGNPKWPYIPSEIKLWKYKNSNWQDITGNQKIETRNNIQSQINSTSFQVDNNNDIYLLTASKDNDFAIVKKQNSTTLNWDYIGDESNIGNGGNIQLSTSKDNVTYLNYGLDVKKFNGTSWELIPSFGLPINQMYVFSNITFDANNIPYIAYTQRGTVDEIFVKKFNGTSWEFVGNQTSIKGEIKNIAFDSNNTLFLVYINKEDNNILRVKSYDGLNWSNVGANSIASSMSIGGITFLIDTNNIPLIYYYDMQGNHVKRFLNSNWEEISDLNTYESNDFVTKMAIDNLNNIYILGYNNSLRKYNGTNWETIAELPTDIRDISLTINKKDNTIYLDGLQKNEKIIVKKLNGTVWENLNNYPTRSFRYRRYSFIINNNIPQIAYDNNGLFAKYYGDSNALNVENNLPITHKSITIYPNPIKNTFSISGTETISEIRIYDLLGKSVFHQNYPNQEINIEFLPKGFYILKAKTEKGFSSSKIIKE